MLPRIKDGTSLRVAGLCSRVGLCFVAIPGMECSHAGAQRIILLITNAEADLLFNANWPVKWVKLAGLALTDQQIEQFEEGEYSSQVFFPNPGQAVDVLRYFASLGYIPKG